MTTKKQSNQSRISTTAIAKQLDLPAKNVFTYLLKKNWIDRVDDHWRLTGKGEFEGGEYINSKKYGEYIGWPTNIVEHQVFHELLNLPISTKAIGQQFEISIHRCNAIFSELGWQKRFHRGWLITPSGAELGGSQEEDNESGVPYTVWPRDILDNERLLSVMDKLQVDLHPRTEEETELSEQAQLDFEKQTPLPARAMDGHDCLHYEDLALDNWLYLMGVIHAYQRELPDAGLGHCDFYLPSADLYLECWHARDTGKAHAEKLERLEYYKTKGLAFIEINAEDLNNLDSVMPRRLLRHGITVF